MQDIADAVGGSRVTVSLVLNNKAAASRISQQVQTAVRDAAHRMGYRPNVFARRLKSADNTLFIALATARQAPLTIISSTYLGADLAISAASMPVQLTVEFFSRGLLYKLPGLLDGSRFNGVIVNNSAPEDDAFLDSQDFQTPIVVFNRHVQKRSYIDATSRASGHMAAQVFIEQSRQHPCVLYCSALTQSTADRWAGFDEALVQAGYPPPTPIAGDTFSERGGYDAMCAFLKTGQPCDAIFAVGDYMALGALSCLRQAGRRVPDDVAVIGHDNVDMAEFSTPSLTTIHLPLVTMAQDALKVLVRIISGEMRDPVQRTYNTHLVRRESA